MLVKQIHAAWQADNGVTSLLSLDMTMAFDRVVPVRLLQIIKKRCIIYWLINFISSILSDKTTSLCFPGVSSTPFSSKKSVSQGSPLFHILLLFDNADQIDVCNSPVLFATSNGCVNDANVSAFGKSTEETCSVLKGIHCCCLI
jgi:hypothetical protein